MAIGSTKKKHARDIQARADVSYSTALRIVTDYGYERASRALDDGRSATQILDEMKVAARLAGTSKAPAPTGGAQ